MTDTITLPRSVAEQALEALKIGHESAHDCAETFHIEMAGYKQQRHEALDAEVKQISDAIEALRAALEQPQVQSGGIPPNWKLVPVEPTNKMAGEYWKYNDRTDVVMRDAWKALLAAAPQPPVVEQPQGTRHETAIPDKLASQAIDALASYCNTGEIEGADDLLASLLYSNFRHWFARAIERAHGIGGEA